MGTLKIDGELQFPWSICLLSFERMDVPMVELWWEWARKFYDLLTLPKQILHFYIVPTQGKFSSSAPKDKPKKKKNI